MRWKAKPFIYFWLSYVVFCPVLEECWNKWIKLYICFRVCCFFLKVVRSKRTVGVASVHGSVSSKDTSPIKRRSVTRRCQEFFFVFCFVIVVSVGDFSNRLAFSGSKTQLSTGFSGLDWVITQFSTPFLESNSEYLSVCSIPVNTYLDAVWLWITTRLLPMCCRHPCALYRCIHVCCLPVLPLW